MKKNIVAFAFILLASLSQTTQAALVNGQVLLIESGSIFSLESSPGVFVETIITGVNGIRLGSIQLPGTSHPGPIDGTENPNIDIWTFYTNTGMDYTTSPMFCRLLVIRRRLILVVGEFPGM